MSMFDLFTIKFESDTKDLKKGLDESKKTSDGIQSSLKGVDLLADKAGHGLKELAIEAAGALAALFAIHHVISDVSEALDFAEKTSRLSEVMGVNVEQLSAWSDAVTASGGSADAFQESIKGMTEKMIQVEVTGKGRVKPFFDKLGIDLTSVANKGKTAMDFLPQIATQFEKIGKSESFGFGKKLGLDEGTIMLLQRGGREVSELVKRQKELGVITKEDGEATAKFKMEQADFGHIMRSVWLGIGEAVLPVIDDILIGAMKLFGFIKDHSTFFISAISGVAVAIGITLRGAFVKMGLAAWEALIPMIPMIAAVLAVGAAIAIAAIVFEDLWAWMHGSNSLIGDLIGSFDDLKKKPGELWDAFAKKFPAIADLIKTIGNLLGIGFKLSWDAAVEAFKVGGKVISGVFDGLKLMLEGVWEVLKLIVDGWSKIGGLAVKGLEIGLEHLGFANSVGGLNSATSNSIANSSASTTQNHVTVQKVEVNDNTGNADAISKSIGTSLHSELKNVHNSFATGRAA